MIFKKKKKKQNTGTFGDMVWLGRKIVKEKRQLHNNFYQIKLTLLRDPP